MTDLAQIVIQATDKSRPAVDSAVSGIANLGNMAGQVQGKLAALVGAVSVGAFAAIVTDSIKGAAALQQFSEMTGASVEGLSALKSVAKLSGTDFETITGSLTKLSKTLSTALNPDSPAAKSLEQLGISAIDASGNLRATDQVTLELAKKFDQYADGPGKVAAAMALYGKEGAKMIPVLKDLAVVGDLQAKITTAQAEAADQLEKDFKKLGASSGAVKTIFSMEMVPAIDAFVKTLLQAQEGAGGLREWVKKLAADGTLAEWGRNVAMYLGYAVDGFQYLWRAMEITGKFIGTLAASLGDFSDLIYGMSQMMVGNFGEGFKYVNHAMEGLRAGFKGFGEDAKKIMGQEVFSTGLAENLLKTSAAAQEAKAAIDPLKFATKEATDKADEFVNAWNAMVDELGKTEASATAQIDFMQRFGMETKSTKEALVQFAITEGKLKDASAEDKAVILAWARRIDGIKNAEEALKRYLDLVKKEQEDEKKSAEEYAQWKLDTLTSSLDTLRDRTASLNADLIANDKDRATAQLQIEAEKWRRIIAIYEEGSQERKDIEEKYGAWLQANVTKIEVDHWRSTMDYGRQTITNLITDWSGGLKKIGQDIKTYLVDALARLAMQQWVIPIVANISGTSTSVLTSAMGVNNSPIGNILGAGSSLGNILGVSAGSIFGGSAAYGAALGTTSIGAGSQAAMLAAQTGEFGAAGLSATAGAAGGAAGGATSFLASAGPYAAALLAAYAIYNALKKPGGPKEGGSYIASYGALGNLTGLGGDRLYTPNTQDAQAKTIGSGIAATFYEQLKALGGTVGSTSFGLGFDADPRGTAGSRIKNQVTVNGQQVYSVLDRDVGRDPAALQSALKQESARAILAALQSSTLPPMIAGILNSVTASSATEQEIDAVLARAKAMQDLFGTLGDAIDVNLGGKVKTAIEVLEDQGAALVKLARASDNSADSIAKVVTATAQYRASVTQLIASFDDAKGAIGKTIDDAIRGYKFGNLDKQGQYNMLQGEAAGLYASISGLSDAGAIKDVISQIVSLSGQAYGLLDDSQKKQKEEEFIAGLQGARDEANKRLIDLQKEAAETANKNLDDTRKVFTEIAEQQQTTANQNTAAVNTFAAASGNLAAAIRAGININIGGVDAAVQSGA